MTTKIDVRMIIGDHFATLRDEGTSKISRTDIAVICGIPIAVGLVAYFLCFRIPDQYIGTLISVFAIFVGLLFNVQVLIYNFSDRDEPQDVTTRNELLRQSFANISYAILVSLAVVILLSFLLFSSGWLEAALEAIVVALAINFVLSLLMVLKRMHVLLRSKFVQR